MVKSGKTMKRTKNQKRMEALGAATAILKDLMIEVRDKSLSRAELAGLGSELREVEAQAKILRQSLEMIEYRESYRGVFAQHTKQTTANT